MQNGTIPHVSDVHICMHKWLIRLFCGVQRSSKAHLRFEKMYVTHMRSAIEKLQTEKSLEIHIESWNFRWEISHVGYLQGNSYVRCQTYAFLVECHPLRPTRLWLRSRNGSCIMSEQQVSMNKASRKEKRWKSANIGLLSLVHVIAVYTCTKPTTTPVCSHRQLSSRSLRWCAPSSFRTWKYDQLESLWHSSTKNALSSYTPLPPLRGHTRKIGVTSSVSI